MKNKIKKTVYLLKNEKNMTIRAIKAEIKLRFGVILSNDLLKVYSNTNNIVKNEKYSHSDKRKILYMYQHIKNSKKLIEYLNLKYNYNLTLSSIQSLASKYGVNKLNKYPTSIRQVSKEDIDKIKTMYEQGSSGSEIAHMFGYKTRNSIYQILDSVDIARRNTNDIQHDKKSYKHFDISKIDTEFNAYFLGLLYTDGYVHNNKSTHQHYIQLTLKDKDVMDFISEHIKCKVTNIKKNNCIHYRIQLHGIDLVNQVEKYGIIQAKTKTLLPTLDDSINVKYLLRGIIDGDGWVRKDGKEFFICSASINFMNWLKVKMEYMGFKNIYIRERKTVKGNKDGVIFDIRTSLKHNISILKSIYDKPFGMSRKYNRVHQVKERPSETIMGGSLQV